MSSERCVGGGGGGGYRGGRAVLMLGLLALTVALATVAYAGLGGGRGLFEMARAHEDLLDEYVRHVEQRTRAGEADDAETPIVDGDVPPLAKRSMVVPDINYDAPRIVKQSINKTPHEKLLSKSRSGNDEDSKDLEENNTKERYHHSVNHRRRRHIEEVSKHLSVHSGTEYDESKPLKFEDLTHSEILQRRKRDIPVSSELSKFILAEGKKRILRDVRINRSPYKGSPLHEKRYSHRLFERAQADSVHEYSNNDHQSISDDHISAIRKRSAAEPSPTKRRERASGTGAAAGARGELNWTRSAWLDEERERVRLSWLLGDGVAVLKVEARTTGWVGLGFSPAGGMAGADMAVGWVDDRTGASHVVDCYGAERAAAPLVDSVQDYELLRAAQNATHTLLVLRRKLETCDSQHDLPLGDDTARVVWALGERDPGEGAAEAAEAGAGAAGAPVPGLRGHGPKRRGGRSLHLATPAGPPAPALPPPAEEDTRRDPRPSHSGGVRAWDVRMRNVTIRGDMDTLYWCKIFRAPPLPKKHHIIGFEPWLQRAHGPLVHHMLLYECDWPRAAFQKFDAYAEADGKPCYGSDMPAAWERCLTPVAAWAVGSEGEMFPEHVGLPLAMGDKAQYFMLEVHYDNPSLETAKDSSGLRLFYTEELRRFDGGVLATGVTVTPLHVIPPRQDDYRTAGYCSGACTRQTLPREGVRLVSVLLHSHLAGRRLRLRQLRGGRALRDVARDDRYDFRFQQSRRLQPEVHLRPGDELVTECAYSTRDRTHPTFGGYSTKQEMCLAFVVYYPRAPVAACYSMTPVKYFFWAFGVSRFYGTNMDDVERVFLKLDLPDAQKGGANAVGAARSTTTTTTTTTTALPQFAVDDPEMAMDEELNRKAIQALKKMRGFTEQGVSEGGGGGDWSDSGSIGDLVIAEPAEFRNKTFREHLRQLPWAEDTLVRSLERSLYYGEHQVFCRMPDDVLAMPAAIYNFPNFTEPEENKTSTCGSMLQGIPAQGGGPPASAHLPAALALTAAVVVALLMA